MAPKAKVQVPMDFGVHLRTSPTHNTLKLNTSEGGEVLASSVILSFNSPVIDHMTTTLHMTSVDMLEFSEAAVQVFVYSAYSGTAEGINREIFRDINKMANVFEVVWLMKKCSEYFTEVTNSIVTPSYSELLYLFGEACFVYENLNKKDYIEVANYKIQELNWKEQFIDKYLENADRLSTKKLDMVIELAGSDVNFVVQTLVNQLTEIFKVQGPSLPKFCKYLLDTMDLSISVKSERRGFYQLFELLENLPSECFKWGYNLLLRSTKEAASSDLLNCARSSTAKQVTRCDSVPNLYLYLNFGMSFDELLEWISMTDCINSLLVAVEAVFTWHYYHYIYTITSSTNSNVDFGVNENRLETELYALAKRKGWLIYSPDMTTFPFRLYTKAGILQSKEFYLTSFCTSNGAPSYLVLNCREDCRDPYLILSKQSKLTFDFKHPSVTSCNLTGKCGFILKTVPSKAALWKLELCTKQEDYSGVDVHFHEEIKAENMHVYYLRRTSCGPRYIFPLTWLGCVSFPIDTKKWRWFDFSDGSKVCVAYNINQWPSIVKDVGTQKGDETSQKQTHAVS